jgi:hypothetical protein
MWRQILGGMLIECYSWDFTSCLRYMLCSFRLLRKSQPLPSHLAHFPEASAQVEKLTSKSQVFGSEIKRSCYLDISVRLSLHAFSFTDEALMSLPAANAHYAKYFALVSERVMLISAPPLFLPGTVQCFVH